MGARVTEVVETDLELRGDGDSIPIRRVTQYWSKGGTLLAEFDPCARQLDDEEKERLRAKVGEIGDSITRIVEENVKVRRAILTLMNIGKAEDAIKIPSNVKNGDGMSAIRWFRQQAHEMLAGTGFPWTGDMETSKPAECRKAK